LSLAAFDFANQVSLFAVMAMALAVLTLCASHLARHYGMVRQVAANQPAPSASPSLDPLTQREAGLPAPSADQRDLATVPTDAFLRRGVLKGGTWIPILMYHYIRIAPEGDHAGYTLSVTPTDFAAQMRYLSAHGYTALTMRDVDLVLMGKKQLPLKPVALTFDDGYVDFYTTAVPVLRTLGFTATDFVPTQLVGDARGAYMTWPQVEQLDAEGFEMAAHSQFHVDVSKVNASRARIEIFGAKADLEAHLGHPVFDWAYPYGGFNFTTVTLVHDAGYWSGAITQAGGYHDADQLPLLSRLRVGGGQSLDYFIGNLQAR
jgi:peptidoglycan/xylan/chitin deacetylase (PgdA/CDA1 family)